MTTPLHKPRGEELEFATCFYCQAVLPDNPRLRKLGHTSLGMRNFCREILTKPPEQYCYAQFKRRFI